MTDQERVQAFLTAYQQLVNLYGVDWVAELAPRQYGAMIQIEPEIAPGLVPDWTQPEPEKEPKK